MILSFCSGLFYLSNFGVQTAGSVSHRLRHLRHFSWAFLSASHFPICIWTEKIGRMPKAMTQSTAQEHASPLFWDCLLVTGLCAGAGRQMQGEPFLQGFPTGCTRFGRENGNGEFSHPVTIMCPSQFLFPSLWEFSSLKFIINQDCFVTQTALSFELNCNTNSRSIK